MVERTSGDPIWQQALDLISQQVNEGTYRIWFEPTVGLGLKNGTYFVGVASEFAKDWIDTRFRALMSDSVAQVLGEPVAFNIVVSPAMTRADEPSATRVLTAEPRSTSRSFAPAPTHAAPPLSPARE